jgi:hypothetical protein
MLASAIPNMLMYNRSNEQYNPGFTHEITDGEVIEILVYLKAAKQLT